MSAKSAAEVVSECDLKAEVGRLERIVTALMDRAERSTNVQDSGFGLFQTTIMLEEQVRQRTRELEAALRQNEAITRALQVSEAKFRGLVSQSLVGIAIIEDGRFTYANPRLAEMSGLAVDELLQVSLVDITSSEDKARIAERIEGCQTGVLDHLDCTAGLVHKDGTTIDTECHISVITLDGSAALMGLFLDVSQRKKLELDLRHAQKLESVGRLAAGVAHEINTPIQFVGDNLRFLQDGFGTALELTSKLREATAGDLRPDEIRRSANDAVGAADWDYMAEEIPKALSQSIDGVERVAAIVKAMKDFAHPEQGRRVAADLNRALASTLMVARNAIKYVADVETDFGEIPLVECHLGDLNQVFLNLLLNAAQAISETVTATGGRGTIRIRTHENDGWVRIEISDTGCGIPDEIRTKVFDPFFTTKGVGGGSGQGLAISRSIVVDRHGGTLTFESQVGTGTTFAVELPASGAVLTVAGK